MCSMVASLASHYLYCYSFLQVIVVPCGLTASLTEAEKDKLLAKCDEYVKKLEAAGVLAKGDFRDNYSPGWKFNHWELKAYVFCFVIRCNFFSKIKIK